jgi:hypothetical protein
MLTRTVCVSVCVCVCVCVCVNVCVCLCVAASSSTGVLSHSKAAAVVAGMDSGELGIKKRKVTDEPVKTGDGSEGQQQQAAKRPYNRTAPTLTEVRVRNDELVEEVGQAKSELQRTYHVVARLEQVTLDMQQQLDKNGYKIVQLQQAVASRDAMLLHTQQQLATCEVEVEDKGHQLETFDVEVEDMEAKVHRLSGYHPADAVARIKKDLKNEYAGKLGKRVIVQRNKQRRSMAIDLLAKEEALERDALELAGVRVKFAFLNGPQAKRDDKAMEKIKKQEKTRKRKNKVNANAKREVRKLKREDARAICNESESDESYSGSGSDSDDSNNEYDFNDGFLVPDGEEEDKPQPMDIEA